MRTLSATQLQLLGCLKLEQHCKTAPCRPDAAQELKDMRDEHDRDSQQDAFSSPDAHPVVQQQDATDVPYIAILGADSVLEYLINWSSQSLLHFIQRDNCSQTHG